MKRMSITLLLSLLMVTVYSPAQTKTRLMNEFNENAGELDISKYFNKTTLTPDILPLAPPNLENQAAAVLDYLTKYKNDDPAAVHAGLLAQRGVTTEDVENTLRFIQQVMREDRKNGAPNRMLNPAFLRRHFRVYRWLPYHPPGRTNNRPADTLRITRYAVFTVKGNTFQTNRLKHALYALPDDETGLTIPQAEKQKNTLNRFKYTKQQILNGAYANGGSKPLVWLTRNGLEEALMEGSICVELPNGAQKFFNVDRNNNIPYDTSIKNPRDQKRYWYFGEVAQPQGYGMDVHSQLQLFPEAAVAGDVYNMGLGKVIGLAYKDKNGKQKIRLTILADTGGAFTPNLHQLDFYAGVFPNRQAFRNKKQTPAFAEVYILITKMPSATRTLF